MTKIKSNEITPEMMGRIVFAGLMCPRQKVLDDALSKYSKKAKKKIRRCIAEANKQK